MTAIINKFGTVMMTISKCSDKQIRKGLCGNGSSPISGILFNDVFTQINKLFDENKDILIKKSLIDNTSVSSNFNTVTGYAPSGKICRLTRTRDTGSGNYKEGMRPEPYSWKGQCPDPNYQYLKPEGVQDTNGLWFPCCETKTKDSVKMMKEYLLTGFPKNKEQAEMYNITPTEDLGSGILIPDSNVVGATAMVNIDGEFEEVTVLKKLSKKSNEYKVRTSNGEKIVKGTDFKRDSRAFRGLNSFKREELLNCIFMNMRRNSLSISGDGDLIKNTTSELNERYNQENAGVFTELETRIIPDNLTYYNMRLFEETSFNVRRCPKNSYNFYLVLSALGNFYINNDMKSIDSQITNTFDNTIVLNGYLQFNETENMNEYHIIDVLYFDENLQDKTYSERYRILFDLQNLVFTNIINEIFVYPDVYSNVIDGSYIIMSSFPESKLVFLTDSKMIVWGDTDILPDTFELQVLSKNKQVIEFGYAGSKLPEGLGLDFLSSVSFNKREIPEDLFVNDYFEIKINRDFEGNIVPNRKISILYKTNVNKTYDQIVNYLLFKFNNIDSTFFSSNKTWDAPDKTLEFDGEKLKEI